MVLDDDLDFEVGRALAELVRVALGVGQGAEDDQVGLIHLAQKRLPGDGTERAGDRGSGQ